MQVAVQLFGGFRVRDGARDFRLPSPVADLVVALALDRGRVRRPRLAGMLWPDNDERSALSNLRTVLWKAKQTAGGLFATDRDSVALGPDVSVDLWERLDWFRHDPMQGDRQRWRRFRCEQQLLVDRYDENVLVERERVRLGTIRALERAIEAHRSEEEIHDAVDAGMALITVEPLRASSYRQLVELYLEIGERYEATRVVTMCDQIFEAKLGVSAPSDLRQLVEQRMGPDPKFP